MAATGLGRVVILNGAPRSGKSSIVAEIQRRFDGPWMNLGVDVWTQGVTPERYRPGIGLRPGGERPEVEELVPRFYAALYEAVAAHSRLGLDVVVDVGHHDGYRTPRRVLADVARRLDGLPAYLVGVRCPPDVVTARRNAGEAGRGGVYVTSGPDGETPEVVLRWEREVHAPGIYDLEVDTSLLSPAAAADAVRGRLVAGPPDALRRILAATRA